LRIYFDRTVDDPPKTAPPNFAVNPEWPESHGKTVYAAKAKRYLKMPDVPGFDEYCDPPYFKDSEGKPRALEEY